MTPIERYLYPPTKHDMIIFEKKVTMCIYIHGEIRIDHHRQWVWHFPNVLSTSMLTVASE